MVVWGSGRPLREFLHVDDLADALIYLAKNYSDAEIVNVGSGEEVSIADLARLIAQVVGFDGELRFDAGKPDGMARKLVDTTKINTMGWRHSIPVRAGLADTYRWFLENQAGLRGYAGVQ